MTPSKPKSNITEKRRKSKDFWFYLVRGLTIASWLLFIFALGMSYYAAPDADYGVLRYREIEIRKFWLAPLTGYLYIILWVSALTSYLSIVLDNYRNRRKEDSSHFNAFLLLLITMAWIVYILLNIK